MGIEVQKLPEGRQFLDIVATTGDGKTSHRRLEFYTGDVFLTDIGARFDERRQFTECRRETNCRGEIALTGSPRGPNSAASTRAIALSPALVARYPEVIAHPRDTVAVTFKRTLAPSIWHRSASRMAKYGPDTSRKHSLNVALLHSTTAWNGVVRRKAELRRVTGIVCSTRSNQVGGTPHVTMKVEAFRPDEQRLPDEHRKPEPYEGGVEVGVDIEVRARADQSGKVARPKAENREHQSGAEKERRPGVALSHPPNEPSPAQRRMQHRVLRP